MEYFGLKLGQDLGNRAAHPYQEFRGVPPPPGGKFHSTLSTFGVFTDIMFIKITEQESTGCDVSLLPNH